MRKLAAFIVFFAWYMNVYSQEFSNKSIIFSAGLSVTANLKAEGFGLNFGLGYQKGLWGNRLRVMPSLTYGIYTNFGVQDASPANINSTNLKININYDLLRIKSFSLFIGTGITGNYSISHIKEIGTFRETHFAFNGLFGFRIYPPKKKLGYELKVLELIIEPTYEEDYYEGGILQFGVIYKLN